MVGANPPSGLFHRFGNPLCPGLRTYRANDPGKDDLARPGRGAVVVVPSRGIGIEGGGEVRGLIQRFRGVEQRPCAVALCLFDLRQTGRPHPLVANQPVDPCLVYTRPFAFRFARREPHLEPALAGLSRRTVDLAETQRILDGLFVGQEAARLLRSNRRTSDSFRRPASGVFLKV